MENKLKQNTYVYLIRTCPHRKLFIQPTSQSFNIYNQDCDLTLVKVGVSKAPDKRLAQLSTASPFNMEVYLLYGPFEKRRAHYIEKRIHTALKPYGLSGEWFALTRQDLCNAVEGINMSGYTNLAA